MADKLTEVFSKTQGVPWVEHQARRATRVGGRSLIYAYLSALRHLPPKRMVCFSPEKPRRAHLIWKVMSLLRAADTDSATEADIRISYERSTYSDRMHGSWINGACTDIGKDNVENAFSEAFGVSTVVEPKTYRGPIVEKSIENATHDGRIIYGPTTETRPNCIYQRLLDNTERDFVRDIRICIVGNEIPYVIEKNRPISVRFSNLTLSARVVDVNDTLSVKEIEQTLKMARLLGIDIGELDAIRTPDGQVYIVDANKNPYSPPAAMMNLSGLRCMYLAAHAFERQFLDSPATRQDDQKTNSR